MNDEVVELTPDEQNAVQQEEQANAKNGRRIFWLMVALFGGAIIITILENLWKK